MITHPNRGRMPDPVKLAVQLDASVKRLVAALEVHEKRRAASKPTESTAKRLAASIDGLTGAYQKLRDRAAAAMVLGSMLLFWCATAYAQSPSAFVVSGTGSAVPATQAGPLGLGSGTETIDLGLALNVLLPLMMAVVTTAIPIIIPFVLKRLGVANNADLTNKLTTACDAAAGLAYKYAASHEGGLSSVAVHDGALAVGANYVISGFPSAMAKLGLTPEKVAAMVEARLGTLLATDPNVTVGAPAHVAVAVPVAAAPAPPPPPPPAV